MLITIKIDSLVDRLCQINLLDDQILDKEMVELRTEENEIDDQEEELDYGEENDVMSLNYIY